VQRIVQQAVARFGTIDVLVNNASLLGPRVTIATYEFAAWREVMGTNLNGLFLVTREVLQIMLARRSGAIINLTSGWDGSAKPGGRLRGLESGVGGLHASACR